MVSAVFHSPTQAMLDAKGPPKPAAGAVSIAPSVDPTPSPPAQPRSPRLDSRDITLKLLPPLMGIALLIGVWALLTLKSTTFPTPLATFSEAVKVFSDPVLQQGAERPGHRLEHPVLARARGAGLWHGGAGGHSAGLS